MPEKPPRSRLETSARRGTDQSSTRRVSRRRRRSNIPSKVPSLAWKTALAGIVLVVLALLIGSYTFLPTLMGSLFGQTIQGGLGLATTPEVELKSKPPPSILTGEFAEGRVEMGAADFQGVRPDKVIIDLDPFELDVIQSMRNGTFESRGPLSGTLRLELPEKEVTRIAESRIEDVPIRDVQLEPGRTIVGLEARFLGVDVPVSVDGNLRLRQNELTFDPRGVEAFGVPIPERISERLLSQADFGYPLDDLPYDAKITGIKAEKDRLVLSGDIERIPVGETGG